MCLPFFHDYEAFAINNYEIECRVLYRCKKCNKRKVKNLQGTWTLYHLNSFDNYKHMAKHYEELFKRELGFTKTYKEWYLTLLREVQILNKAVERKSKYAKKQKVYIADLRKLLGKQTFNEEENV